MKGWKRIVRYRNMAVYKDGEATLRIKVNLRKKIFEAVLLDGDTERVMVSKFVSRNFLKFREYLRKL